MLPESKIKERLIEKIRNTEDEELLAQILRMIDQEEEIESVYQLDEDEIRAINQGLDDNKNGRYLTNEEVKEQTAKWLRR